MSGDRLARAYRSASVRRDQIVKAVNGCFDGLWLGLLDRDALARLDETFYTDGRDVLDGRAFNYTEEQHNLSGLQPWEAAAVVAHFPTGGRVVVTGAGGGREVIALVDRGFDAVGYEPNPALVSAGSALLERHGHPGRLLVCERDAFPADAEPCDAVVVGWGSYMLIPGRTRRIAFLQAARRVLPDGAPLLCSFFVRPGSGRYFKAVSGTANVVRRLRGGEPAEVGDAVGHNFVHAFTREEIASELAAAGFRMTAYAAEPYGHAVAVAGPPAGLNGHAPVRRIAAERPAPAPPLDPVLELTGITKRWPRLERPVLDGVNLALEPGTTTIIGGRNGTGKTTLLRIAAGLIGPDTGSVRLDGLHPVSDRAAFQQSVGFLSAANGGLYARLSVAWHLDWWARLAFIPQERRQSVIAAALRRFDLEALRDRRADRLSMGQRQRVRLAGAFLHDPDVLLLDEPANSLDGEGIALLARAIDDAVDRGASALVCMPSGIAEAIEADRHLLLDNGILRT